MFPNGWLLLIFMLTVEIGFSISSHSELSLWWNIPQNLASNAASRYISDMSIVTRFVLTS